MPKIPHHSQKNSNNISTISNVSNNLTQKSVSPTPYISNHMPNQNVANKDNQAPISLNNQRNNYISPNSIRS
jgi:hypothetical protein